MNKALVDACPRRWGEARDELAHYIWAQSDQHDQMSIRPGRNDNKCIP